MINFDRLKNPFLRTGSGLCNYIVSEAIQLYFAFSIDNDIKWHNDCSSIKKKITPLCNMNSHTRWFFSVKKSPSDLDIPWNLSVCCPYLNSSHRKNMPHKYKKKRCKMYIKSYLKVGQWTVFYSRNTKGGNSFNLCLEFEQIVTLHRCM